MKTQLGEEGTEQFTVESRLDGKTIKVQPIHDPFIHSTVGFKGSRWDHFKAIFRPPVVKVEVIVRASEAAQRAIMTLDPVQLTRETEEILEGRRQFHESGCAGMCNSLQGETPQQIGTQGAVNIFGQMMGGVDHNG